MNSKASLEYGEGKFTGEEFEAMEQALRKRLGRNYISERPGQGGNVWYLEGWKSVDLANRIFGFNGNC